MRLLKGKILAFEGDPYLNVSFLAIKHDDGTVDITVGQFSEIVSKLISAYPDILGMDFKIDLRAVKDREIYYTAGDFGVLFGFTPIEQADPQLSVAYGYYKGKDILEESGQTE
jgi:hypothetical protein